MGELQMISLHAEQLHKQVEAIHQKLAELEVIKESVADIGKVPVGNEVLVPVSKGIFIKANLKDNKNVILNVGGNTAVEKTLPDASRIVDEQIREIKKLNDTMVKEMVTLGSRQEQLREEITNLSKNV